MRRSRFGPTVRLILRMADVQIAQLKYERRMASSGDALRVIDRNIKELESLRAETESALAAQL